MSLSFGQVSLSIGFSNKFQTDNKHDEGNSWYGGRYTVKVHEQYLINAYSCGIDYQRNKFNLMVDMCLWTNKLAVTSASYYSNGYQSGSISTTTTYDYRVNYGYLGLRISPQRVFEIKENVDIVFGPFVQFQLRVYEREYDHMITNDYYSSSSSTWSVTTDNSEFNGMDLTRESGILGISLYPKIKFNKYTLSLMLSGGLGLTSRRDLTYTNAAWSDKMYGFGEIGFKVGYRLANN